MCKLRFLTQGCEDLALVSLSYSSPLAKHASSALILLAAFSSNDTVMPL